MTSHEYRVQITWQGNEGTGTSSYRAYGRNHEVEAVGVPPIPGSADPAFRGDAARWNPEQLLVASIAQCHMLWYLHLASEAGVVVTAYEDEPLGIMSTDASGAGQFERVTVRPRVTISAESDAAAARDAHARVGDVCFIARSVNFPVEHDPTIIVE